jgi:hypothetical protein
MFRTYKQIILLIVLCKTSSFTPWEEHKLSVSENKQLRRIFGPKKKEGEGGYRKLHSEEDFIISTLHKTLLSLSRMGIACNMHG